MTTPLAESLLTMLYRRWCEDKQSRAHPRHSASGAAQTCAGMPTVHYFVTGRAFPTSGGSRQISQVQHEQIATLGRVAMRHGDEPGPPPDFAVETWQIKDESASGLRLARVDPAASSRLMLGQLLGIRLGDAKALLCTVKWLSVSVEFELRIGVQILPGIPQGVTIRAADAAAEQQPERVHPLLINSWRDDDRRRVPAQRPLVRAPALPVEVAPVVVADDPSRD